MEKQSINDVRFSSMAKEYMRVGGNMDSFLKQSIPALVKKYDQTMKERDAGKGRRDSMNRQLQDPRR